MAFQNCDEINELVGWEIPESGCFNVQIIGMKLNKFSNINQAGTTLATDAATNAECLDTWAVIEPSVEVGFDSETAQLSWQKSSENGYYENTLTIPAAGLSKAVWAGMKALCKTCGTVANLKTTDCQNIFVGADWDGAQLRRQYVKSGYVSDHSGSIGGGDPTNTITLTWKTCDAPYLSNIQLEDIA